MKHLFCCWRICAVLGMLLLSGASARAVPIEIDFADGAGEGFNDPGLGEARKASFRAAAQVWASRLEGTVPIRVQANFDDLDGTPTEAILGQAGPGGFASDWQSGRPAPIANTRYAIGLANQFAGSDLSGNAPEIVAQFNSEVDTNFVLGDEDFYYGLDGNPGDDIDFFGVVLHELGHGLGFVGLLNDDGTFDNDRVSSFDRFLAIGATPATGNVAGLSVGERAAAVRSENLFFAGPRARAANGGLNAKLYAPDDFSPGSSIYHLDEETYSGDEELMTPFSTDNPRAPGPINFAVFLDFGWGNVAVTPTPTPTSNPNATPTPTTPVNATPTPRPTATPIVPSNDNFENAQAVIGARVTGSNVNASKQPGEPEHAGNPGGASIWYRWVSPSTGRAVITTIGSSFDTLLAVYVGDSLNDLRLVAANDDIARPGNLVSRVEFSAVRDTVYYIAVDGYRDDLNSISTGSVVLNFSVATGPAPTPTAIGGRPGNDNFVNALPISGAVGRLNGTNRSATSEVREPRFAGGGRTVWYRWTAPANGRWTFTTRGSDRDTVLTVFTGTAVNTLTLVAYDDDDLPSRTSSATFNALAGRVYHLAVDDKTATGGPFVLQWNLAPPNDNFASAKLLPGSAGRSVDRNIGASRETGEPLHARQLGGASIWYRWRAPANGTATFTTLGSNFDTLLNVYTGTALNNLRNAGFADNTGTALTGSVTFSITANTDYYIAVEGKNNAQGSVTLGYSSVLRPSNDNFANARVLGDNSGNIPVSNLNATHEPDEPIHANAGRSRSIWFKWRAPGTGRVTFQGYAGAFSPVVAAYTGTNVDALTSVAVTVVDSVSSFAISWNTVSGTTYSIALDSRDERSGNAGLRWNYVSGTTALKQQSAPSTISARAASDSVQLFFTRASGAAFSQAENYTVTINGVVTEVEGVSVAGNRVSLLLPTNAVRFGDRVSVESALWKGASTCIAQ